MDALFTVPEPSNEPVRSYAPGSPERASLQTPPGRARRRARSTSP